MERSIARACIVSSGLLVACGDNAAALECPTGTTRIEVWVAGELDVAVHREGSSDWFEAVRTPYGYEFCAGATYEFSSACVLESGAVMLRRFSFLSDEMPNILLSDCDGLPGQTFSISGAMVQRGRVSVGGVSGGASRGSPSPSWPFTLSVPPGTYDLLASDAFDDVPDSSQRVVIQRDIAVSSNRVLEPDIDLSVGVPTQVVDVDAAGLESDDRVETKVELRADRSASLSVSAYREPRFRVIPEESLLADEQQLVTIRALSPEFVRSIESPVPVDSQLEFLPRLSGVQFGVRRVTWTMPLMQNGIVTASFFSSFGPRILINASTAWLEAHGTNELGLAEEAPWFREEWAFIPSSSDFSVAAREGDVRRVSSVEHVP